MTTSTKPRAARQGRLHQLAHNDLAAVAVSAVIAITLAAAFMRSPPAIEAVSVTNPSGYDISVQVRGVDGGWMSLSTATSSRTTTTFDVIDQGDLWTFRFASQGRAGGQIEVLRSALDAADWTIEIPDQTIQQLADAGAAVPP